MEQEDNFISAYERHAASLRRNVAVNKAAVFDALAAATITSVTVEFDGEGDSGGIESVTAWRGDASLEVPADSVPFQQTYFDTDALVTTQLTLRDAIEGLCYDCLAQDNDGWENNDGAYGTFTFDVAARTIELEFNERFTDVTTNMHEF